MATVGDARLGNSLGAWIGDRRTASNAAITRRFGQMVLDQHPGMGDYMSRTLFGAPGRERDIRWTVDEIKRLVSVNSGLTTSIKDVGETLGVDILTRYPIAPTYDYLLTLDSAVGDIVNEINRIDSMSTLGSKHRALIDARVLMPDFRPLEFHKVVQLGAQDEQGRDITIGQMLGFPRVYQKAVPFVRIKTTKELAEDNAAILSYVHMNNIIALSQGLWRVNFTPAKAPRLDLGNPDGYDKSAADIRPGAWINSKGPVIAKTTSDSSSNDVSSFLAQDPDPTHYPKNRFSPYDSGDKGTAALIKLQYGGYEPPERWKSDGVTPPTAPEDGGAQPAIYQNAKGRYVVATEDNLSRIADQFKAAGQAQQYFWKFRQIAQALHIDVALRNLHADLQVAYAQGRKMYLTSPTNPAHHVAMNTFNSGCPTGSVRVFKDKEGKMIDEFVGTGSGQIRNPEIFGHPGCAPLVNTMKTIRAPVLVPGLSIARQAQVRAGTWADHDSGSFRAGSFGGGGGGGGGAVSTGRKFQGRAVYKGAKGGLFTQTRGRNGKMTKKYI
jgi:hypothetical protein